MSHATIRQWHSKNLLLGSNCNPPCTRASNLAQRKPGHEEKPMALREHVMQLNWSNAVIDFPPPLLAKPGQCHTLPIDFQIQRGCHLAAQSCPLLDRAHVIQVKVRGGPSEHSLHPRSYPGCKNKVKFLLGPTFDPPPLPPKGRTMTYGKVMSIHGCSRNIKSL